MLNNYILLLLCLVPIGCGDSTVKVDGGSLEDHYASINRFIEEFTQDAEVRGISFAAPKVLVLASEEFRRVKKQYGLSENTVAACVFQSNLMVFDSSQVFSYSPEKLKVLVYHEMGHCALSRGHLSGKCLSGHKKSIMHHSIMFLSWIFTDEEAEQEYLDELFFGTPIECPTP